MLKVVTILGVSFAALLCHTPSSDAVAPRLVGERGTANAEREQNGSESVNDWEPPDVLLGSNRKRRLAEATRLGLAEGEWIVLLASPHCGRCNRVASNLQRAFVAGDERRVCAVVEAPSDEVERWRRELGIGYRVIAVNANEFEEFAGPVVIYPTVVQLKDGVAQAAREDAP